jgi:hypothetical protein
VLAATHRPGRRDTRRSPAESPGGVAARKIRFRSEAAYQDHRPEGDPLPIDAALVGALHVEYLEKRDLLAGEGRTHHTLFQTMMTR